MQTRKLQVLLLTGAAALSVALYFAPKKNISEAGPAAPLEVSLQEVINKYRSELSAPDKNRVEILEQVVQANSADSNAVLQLAQFWDSLNYDLPAAYYFEQAAGTGTHASNWQKAADRYLVSFGTEPDSMLVHLARDRAIHCYEQALAIDPGLLDAKANLGVCYAEDGKDPMKGITLLREVLQADPNHVKAHLNLGVLSVQSGQYEKAVERFKKVLILQPERKDVFLMLNQACLLSGDTAQALMYFDSLMQSNVGQALKEQAVLINKQIITN